MRPLLFLALAYLALCAACAGREDDPVEGTWRVMWACDGCAPGATNPLAYTTEVSIDPTSVTFRKPGCPDCGMTLVGRLSDDGTCFEVEGAPERSTVDAPSWSSFQLCTFGHHLEAQIEWTGYPGPPAPRTWSVHGDRHVLPDAPTTTP